MATVMDSGCLTALETVFSKLSQKANLGWSLQNLLAAEKELVDFLDSDFCKAAMAILGLRGNSIYLADDPEIGRGGFALGNLIFNENGLVITTMLDVGGIVGTCGVREPTSPIGAIIYLLKQRAKGGECPADPSDIPGFIKEEIRKMILKSQK